VSGWVDSKIDQEEVLLSERKRVKGIEVDLTIFVAFVVVVVGRSTIDNSVQIIYFVVVPVLVLVDIHRGLVGMIVVVGVGVVVVVVVVDTAGEEADVAEEEVDVG